MSVVLTSSDTKKESFDIEGTRFVLSQNLLLSIKIMRRGTKEFVICERKREEEDCISDEEKFTKYSRRHRDSSYRNRRINARRLCFIIYKQTSISLCFSL